MDPWIWCILVLCLAILFAFLEVFVPSGGILASLALCALLGSVVFAFLENPFYGAAYFVVMLGVVLLGIWYFFKFWPNSAMGRQILLNPEDDPALQPDPKLLELKRLVGKRGVARSKMMLSGLIEVEGKRLNAISESESLEPGDEIVVVRADGINVLVRKSASTTTSAAQPSAPPKPDEPVIDDPFA